MAKLIVGILNIAMKMAILSTILISPITVTNIEIYIYLQYTGALKSKYVPFDKHSSPLMLCKISTKD